MIELAKYEDASDHNSEPIPTTEKNLSAEEIRFRNDFLERIQRNYDILKAILEDLRHYKTMDMDKVDALKKAENIIDDQVVEQASSFNDRARKLIAVNIGMALGQIFYRIDNDDISSTEEAFDRIYREIWQASQLFEIAGLGLSASK